MWPNNAKTHPQRTLNPKRKSFLSILSRRFAESGDGLNSSLAQSAGELWRCKALQKSDARGLKTLKGF